LQSDQVGTTPGIRPDDLPAPFQLPYRPLDSSDRQVRAVASDDQYPLMPPPENLPHGACEPGAKVSSPLLFFTTAVDRQTGAGQCRLRMPQQRLPNPPPPVAEPLGARLRRGAAGEEEDGGGGVHGA
jgi:hypothetical protein